MNKFFNISGGTLSIGSLNFTFSFGSIVEMILFAVLFYYLMLWFKKTQAWRLFKGLLILLLIYAIAVIFDLPNIQFLFENLFGSIIISFFVIFQPEIRKALEQLGNHRGITSLLKGKSKDNVKGLTVETVDALINACESMSKQKVGALIVLEREIDLTETATTGIHLDALITSALIEQIFEKNTPLHDGAVLVRSNRIVAATCYLPLSENYTISKQYGTRHRAALGVSEKSDALVLVVSEESGHISIAEEGRLLENISSQKLRSILTENIDIAKRQKKGKQKKEKEVLQ